MKELIIKLLIMGKTQNEISQFLKQKNAKPNSLSFVEKVVKQLKTEHKAKTMFHLGVILSAKLENRTQSNK